MKNIIKCLMVFTWMNAASVYATCDDTVEQSTPSSGFVINGGEAYDKNTELTWSRCTLGTTWTDGTGCVGTAKLMRLEDAKRAADTLGAGWRIPTIEELYSIIEHACTEPTINTQVFPSVHSFSEGAPYWADTRVEGLPSLIYYIDFSDGGVDGHTKGFPLAVRLVRSAQ